MKNLILLFILICSFSAFSQDGFQKQKNNVSSASKKSLTITSKKGDKSQGDHIITCLENYRQERDGALGVALIGVGCGIVANYVPGYKDAALIGAGVAGVASLIMYINSERWISRKKLTFAGNSLSYRF